MANITSAGTGNSNDGATWTGGSVPTSSDNAIIQNGHTVTQNAAHTFKSLRVETGGTWTADGSNHLTLSGENDSDFALQIVDGTYNHANGTVVINNGGGGIAHAAIQAGDATSTTGLYDLTISGGGTTCEIYNSTTIHRNMEAGGATTVLRGALTVNGNLTVYGALTTIYSSTSHNLTVNGTTTIGPGSGVADQSTLTCNASTISLGASRQQADYALNIEIGGTFVGGTGANHTFGSLFMAQSANAKATMTTGQVLVNGYNNSANKAWRVEYGGDTFDNANGTVKFQFNGFDSRMSMRGASHANNAFHNLIIHMAGDTRQISPDNGTKIIVDNDLTITRGKLVMGLSHALEVGGNVVIDDASNTAELEMGSSSNISSQAATFGSLTIGSSGTYKATSGTTTILGSSGGFALLDEGTFTHNSGTVKIDFETSNLNSSTRIHQNGAKKLNNVEIEMNRTTDEVTWSVASGTSQGIAGNLTLTKGESYLYSLTHDFDVDGDFLVGANGTWGSLGHSGAHEAKSLTINSGGTYMATSGTTTITGESSGGNAVNIDGTFTHNKGTVKIDYDTSTNLDITGTGGIDLYNLIVDSDATVGYNTAVIQNNLTKQGSGRMRPSGDSGRDIEVKGTLLIEAGTFGRGASDTHTNTFGNVVITGGTIDLTGGGGSGKTIVKGSFRNVGGTVNTP